MRIEPIWGSTRKHRSGGASPRGPRQSPGWSCYFAFAIFITDTNGVKLYEHYTFLYLRGIDSRSHSKQLTNAIVSFKMIDSRAGLLTIYCARCEHGTLKRTPPQRSSTRYCAALEYAISEENCGPPEANYILIRQYVLASAAREIRSNETLKYIHAFSSAK